MVTNNLVDMVERSVRRYPDKPALMWKREGSYRSISYAEMWEEIKNVAAGFAKLGVGWDDKVAIVSANNPQWAITDIAVMSLGAVSVPIHATLPLEQAAYILNNADCQAAVVEDAEQLHKVTESGAAVRHIAVIDPGSEFVETERVFPFMKLAKMGEAHPLDRWQAAWKAIGRDQLATIIHTSGTTGAPKGAMLTHGNILSNIEGVQFWVIEARADDIMLSYLPLSHVFERMAGQFVPLSAGATIAYAENRDTIPENVLEVKPTVMVSVPLLFERVYAQVRQQIEAGTPLRRKIFDWAVKVGSERYDYYLQSSVDDMIRQSEWPASLRRRWKWANALVFQKVKKQLGGRLRGLVSGGGALNEELARFFWSIDIPVLEGYGLTETSPVVTSNPMIRAKAGTVGKALPNLEVRLADDGEVLVRGPSVMSGYYKNEEATKSKFTDGWFRTGDLGEFDEEGYLRIVDRKDSIMVLTTGKNVAPQPVENAINQSVYIAQSALIGHRRKYVIALVVPDFEQLGEWAVKQGLAAEPAELVRNVGVQKLINNEVARAVQPFASHEQPKKIIIVSKAWTEAGGELTPSLKVRIPEIRRKYGSVIEQAYAEDRLKDMEVAADEIAAAVDVSSPM